eukprot:scaffold514694_cov39-Prasinocladus_malaysianus.AAC.1
MASSVQINGHRTGTSTGTLLILLACDTIKPRVALQFLCSCEGLMLCLLLPPSQDKQRKLAPKATRLVAWLLV